MDTVSGSVEIPAFGKARWYIEHLPDEAGFLTAVIEKADPEVCRVEDGLITFNVTNGKAVYRVTMTDTEQIVGKLEVWEPA